MQTATRQNRQIRLAARPQGMTDASTWNLTQETAPVAGPGQVLVQVLYLSLDPAMRGWINEGESYMPPVAVGEVMRALAVGRVLQSQHADFAEGDYVSGLLGAQEYALSDGKGLFKVDPRLAPLPRYLGAFGMPGLTAYFGLNVVGELKDGETVLVSGAAGAVGAIVGQLAKARGCRVIGIAGGADKCAYLTQELGFDAAIDYKSQHVAQELARLCPQGVDVFFDNVGGDILDAALTRLAVGARIVICGAISQYNNQQPVRGPANYLSLLVKRATMKGMVVGDYYPRAMEGLQALAGLAQQGKLKAREHIVQGLEQFPQAFNMLFTGENQGKLVLQLSE
ncbi:NADP-dependent oxidoreductase [Massilia sp. W12]|uniref:NADP-dependent oxidoreductase n=1 Tax=Massilia sp. W12 TaxID=3126507 RepID=UPI0030D2D86A